MKAEQIIAQLALTAGRGVVGLEGGPRGGSGVVLEPGRVLTLARNVRGGEVGVVFSDGRRETATLAGSDPDLGLAVLEADTGEAPSCAWPAAPAAPAIGASVF